ARAAALLATCSGAPRSERPAAGLCSGLSTAHYARGIAAGLANSPGTRVAGDGLRTSSHRRRLAAAGRARARSADPGRRPRVADLTGELGRAGQHVAPTILQFGL